MKAALAKATAPVPATITRRQFFGALLVLHGISKDDLYAIIDTIEDEQTRAIAKVELDEASDFARAHPLINQLAAVIGFDTAAVDEVFLQAPILFPAITT